MRALERHLFTALLTIVLFGIAGGLSGWIWLDRTNRFVPAAEDLIELRGLASKPQVRHRPSSVWFRFESAHASAGQAPVPAELQVRLRDAAPVESALGTEPVQVAVLVVKAELARGPRETPPVVLQLQAGSRTLVPLSLGRELREEQAADARASAWVAAAGVVVSLAALAIHWAAKLRRQGA